MIFQVRKHGKVMFWTEYKNCIPDEETQKYMKSNGYRIKEIDDGEPYKESPKNEKNRR